ncbi:MAG: ABC transporter ATP-binding protein/permease [Deltaproteobacteria bacterium]|nr:ABC transporter ATP-binding protein/permease [Deltaproteobacteria bacterium]
MHLIKQIVAQHRWSLGIGLVALVVVDLLQLLVPRVIKVAVDDLTMGRADAARLLVLAGYVMALAGAIAALRMLWRPLVMGFSRVLEADLRLALFEHFQTLDLAYLTKNPPGELMARATSDLNNLRMASGIGLVAVMDGLMMGLASVGFMLWISPGLTLLAMLPMPATVILTRIQSRKLHKGFNDIQQSFSAMTEVVREAISAVGMVKAYALAPREAARLDGKARDHLELNLGLARIMALMFPVMVFFTNLSLAMVLGGGGPLTVFNRITAGDFVAFIAYLGMLTWPMMALGWVVSLFQRGKASMGRIDQILEARPEIVEVAEPVDLDPAVEKSVAVQGLTFTYPGANRPALADISLAFPAGRATALVGPIGSGKSTLLSLLARLVDPPPGAIRVAGVDVRRLRLAELRRQVVEVPQEAFLFSASVRENLALGRPEATEEELWAALTGAGLAAEMRELPQGLDTLLSERGQSLSGGQRQRLTLARALLLDPPILVLDDPLSAVDTATEQKILVSLARLRQDRTTVVVSHRLASVTFADHIYVLDHGRVVEEGTHAQLLAAGGVYQSLFSTQALLAQVEG